jgi:hypothetical protein
MAEFTPTEDSHYIIVDSVKPMTPFSIQRDKIKRMYYKKRAKIKQEAYRSRVSLN